MQFRRAAPIANRLRSPIIPQLPNRPSLGGSTGRNGPRGQAAAATAPEPEETFSLVPGSNPAAFCMIIRLAPDMVEEMKRVEAQGGKTRLKFDSNPYNPRGNIIDVGGKQFRFTWSQEFGDLCDIYEERQSGEDGNGLLVESGCAWRKLNVQRILDESTKNHVKMRSKEAERKLKSRKAIVLEPGNPSMRSQIKALAAVEATPSKNCNKKKETAPPKKRKVETLQVGGPPKSAYKPGLSSTTVTNGRHSSPLSSLPDQFAASSSPLGAGNISKGIDLAMPSEMIGKQDTNTGSEGEIPTRTNNATRYTPGGKGNNIAKPIDLQSVIISLLMSNPNGLTLKALEKAVQHIVPNPIEKIIPILRKVASYKSPGRYILLPGVHLERFKNPQTETGRSPDPQLPAHEEFHDETPAPQGGFKVPIVDLEELVQLNSKVEEESETLEKINVQHASPDMFGEKKGSDLSEGQGGSSNDGESDSDNDSDSDSDSSYSGSRSDSENDASSKGKEGSDEDGEKESKYNTELSDKRVSVLIPVKPADGRRSLHYEILEKWDDNESDAVKTEKNLPEEQEAEMSLTTATISNKGGKVAEDMPFSPYHKQLQECQNYIGNLFDERENGVKDSSRHQQFDHCERSSKGKHKRDYDVKNIDEKAEQIKRSAAENFGQARGSPCMGVHMFESSHSFTPVGFTKDTFKQSHPQHLKAVNVEIGSQNKLAEMSGRLGSNESEVSQGIELEVRSESNSPPANAYEQDLPKPGIVPYPVKDSKRQTPNSLEEVADSGKSSGFADKNNSDQNRRESSSDEDSCPYLKYEKDKPELKGPIMTFSQYKEYVQEFRDKYDIYISLHENLESYRNEFYEMSEDLKHAKDRDVDRYNKILGELRESYLRHGLKHKRLKKVFIVLHMELEHLKKRIQDFVDANKKNNKK